MIEPKHGSVDGTRATSGLNLVGGGVLGLRATSDPCPFDQRGRFVEQPTDPEGLQHLI